MRATIGCCWPKGTSRGSALAACCEGSRRCRCRTVSKAGQKANERSEAIQRGSVSGEADWGGQNQHSGSAERPKRAALLPQRGQRDLRLTRRGTRARLSGEGEAQNGNSGLNLSFAPA